MPRIFTFEEDGLSYTVTITERDGQIFADITVNEGFMNVNAVYTADDDFSGPSAGLPGPLNMNGAGSQFEGERIQWDDAIFVSRPGLGHQDPENPTFLQAGDTLSVPLNVSSIEEVDFVGIRATSTSTPEGSIKGVSGNPEHEDDDGGDDPEDATYGKVSFAVNVGPNGEILGGNNITADDLPEDAEGTFADYLDLFVSFEGFTIQQLQSVIFFSDDEDLTELFRINAPEGGFADEDALLAAYETAVAGMELDAETAGMFVEVDSDEIMPADALVDEPDEDYVI